MPQDDELTTTPTDDAQREAAHQNAAHQAPTQPDTSGTEGATGGDGGDTESMRAALKRANDEAAQRRHQIKKLEDELKRRERSEMDEADRLKAELAELQGADARSQELAGRLEVYETAVKSQVDALLKELDVPKHIQELIEPMGAAEQLDYLARNRRAFARPEAQKPNIDAANKGRSSATPQELDAKRRDELRKRFRLRN